MTRACDPSGPSPVGSASQALQDRFQRVPPANPAPRVCTPSVRARSYDGHVHHIEYAGSPHRNNLPEDRIPRCAAAGGCPKLGPRASPRPPPNNLNPIPIPPVSDLPSYLKLLSGACPAVKRTEPWCSPAARRHGWSPPGPLPAGSLTHRRFSTIGPCRGHTPYPRIGAPHTPHESCTIAYSSGHTPDPFECDLEVLPFQFQSIISATHVIGRPLTC